MTESTTPMRRWAAAGLLAAALALTGCSTAMTKVEAGDRYLEIMCPANAAYDVLSAAVAAEDLEAIRAAAALRIDAARLAAGQLMADDAGWPSEVSPEDVEAIADYFMSEISSLEVMKDAATLSDAIVLGPDTTQFQTAAQTIRLSLGLSSDTTASCAAFENRGSMDR